MSAIKRFYSTTSHPYVSEVRESLKLIDIEEDYDLVLSRPVGLFFAKIAEKFGASPTTVSFFSLGTGVLGGGLLIFQDKPLIVALGALLIILSGILDSSDGQLARRTKQSSRLGMIIDGTIDSIVFGSCYVFGAMFFLPSYGLWIVLISVISGLLHSFQSLIYDFYKNEFSFLVGKFGNYKTPTIKETRSSLSQAKTVKERMLWVIYQDYVMKQHFLTFRKEHTRNQMSAASENDPNFATRYRQYNRLPMRLWALFGGTNTHRALIILFALIGRFDIYLWVNIGLTLPIIGVTLLQLRADRLLLRSGEV